MQHDVGAFFADRGTGPGKRSRLFEKIRVLPFDVSKEDQPGGSGEGSGGSLYPIGQCTWWVARKRTDLPYFAGRAGDAMNWARSAAAAGFPVDGIPVAGDVAVFAAGQGAGKYGHVAYVERVVGPTIWISEANFEQRHPGSERSFTWPGAALQFIHRKPDGPAPDRSPLESPTPGSPAPAVPLNKVTIDPPPNSKVQTCYNFTGTAELAPGNTLVLALRNLNHTAPVTYFSRVTRWSSGSVGQGAWQGLLFFNAESAYQTFELNVLVMSEAAVAREIAAHGLPPESDWQDQRAVPPDAERAKVLLFERSPGEVVCA
jgi:surface antigen